MTDVDIAFFRALLLETREKILTLKDARQQSQKTVVLDQTSVGRLSRMDAMQQQAMAQAGQRNTDLMLVRIEAALKRCDDGSFGLCVGCDEPIAAKRLQFDPTIIKCIACARAAE